MHPAHSSVVKSLCKTREFIPQRIGNLLTVEISFFLYFVSVLKCYQVTSIWFLSPCQTTFAWTLTFLTLPTLQGSTDFWVMRDMGSTKMVCYHIHSVWVCMYEWWCYSFKHFFSENVYVTPLLEAILAWNCYFFDRLSLLSVMIKE